MNINGVIVYVDYVYNYDSLKNFLIFVCEEYFDGCLIVFVGSMGDKVIFCCKDFGRVFFELVDVVVLIIDDLVSEDLVKIC